MGSSRGFVDVKAMGTISFKLHSTSPMLREAEHGARGPVRSVSQGWSSCSSGAGKPAEHRRPCKACLT